MILSEFRSLARLLAGRPELTDDMRGRTGAALIATAVTAAVLPAAAVTAGHLGSALLGIEPHRTAALRAAVGFAATAGSILVLAPALTLLLLTLAESHRSDAGADRAGAAAIGILRPICAAGIILGIPPLFGLGPEIGEVLWALFAILISVKILRSAAPRFLAIRKRWAGRFSLRASVGFALMFVAVTLMPAMAVRAFLGAATVLPVTLPEPDALPLPPTPDW